MERSERKGLYQSEYEHDACGVGMVVNIHGGKSHELVDNALKVLENMEHRGAETRDKTGDGAGIMVQIPHEFILLQGIPVPEKGKYGTGLVFLPKEEKAQQQILSVMIEEIEREGLQLMHLRTVPTNPEVLGVAAREVEPDIKQIFVTGVSEENVPVFERILYKVRKRIENRITDEDFYLCSLSSKNIIYKGMLTSGQLRRYFPDLSNDYFTSGLALVHSRFSTNTFPKWKLAQPFRLLAHNGEINTIRGNRGWMKARESVLNSEALGDIKDLRPIVQEGMSDSASLDNVFEFLMMSGLSLPQAMAILVPESFNDKNPISEDLKAFYEYHSILMEPWDGPAALLFSDGRYAGGMLDRNGLRPSRYTITKQGMMVVASEVGVMDFEPGDVVSKGRLQPGKILLIDTQEGKIYYDGEIKEKLAKAHPYREWLNENRVQLEKLKSGRKVDNGVSDLSAKLVTFGFGQEDIDKTIIPMATAGQEPVAAMGNDTPLAVISDRPQVLFNYFRQQFAQVTNPAIDPIREELVMSLTEYIGAVGTNILTPDASNCKMVRLPQPVLTNTQLDILCNIRYKGFKTKKLAMTFRLSPLPLPVREGSDYTQAGEALRAALDKLCKDAEACVDEGVNYIILTDKIEDAEVSTPLTHREGQGEGLFYIPSLLAVSAVHHYLISVGKRVQTALIVESGEIREVMHAALLLGYGASALCPYMTFAVLDDLVKHHKIQEEYATAEKNYIKAVDKGLKKIMSKMGISTIRSYRGAKIFESIGLSEDLLRRYFGTEVSTIGGVGLKEIARDAIRLHAAGGVGRCATATNTAVLQNQGQFAWRKDGIKHAWNPETIAKLQLACRQGSYEKFKEWSKLVDEKESPIFLRDFLRFKKVTTPLHDREGQGEGSSVSLDEVEPVESIVKHFVTGAMSFGALSIEAHEALALAMNKLGARSNTGEGGEDNARYHSEVDGVSLSSKTKQIASGRFGVTAEYLVNAEEIQIKVAQGAKPGEGGQLPGFKVNEIIAKTRNAIPGISLISPPPHHDIYSIEDLAQLIFDLKNINPTAAVSVKLVAESGVGTIAAGVAKAKADLIVISGAEGGTGASPASSMRFAGISPEIGLAETQQTLVINGLRNQVRLQTDGQLKTAKDVIIMAMLGADEFSFGTLPLIVLGCVMMRKCNTNTCPMGVATQNPELRKHFEGRAEYVVNYFTFLAEQVREYLAEIGVKSLKEIIGHTELIEATVPEASASGSAVGKWKTIDFARLLHKPATDKALYWDRGAYTKVTGVKDEEMIKAAQKAIDEQEEVTLDYAIKNTDRAVGTMLSGVIAKKYGEDGLPDGTIKIKFKGSAGQSFGAFAVKGLDLRLEGETNDYFGKGLSGGRISILPPARRSDDFKAEENIIAGNTGLYGATSGELYINGKVGERFGVRNSGAIAVIEGAGDHCCEYMTGGRVVVLGKTGRNFAAGMSGGVAYVYDPNHTFDYFCNMDMVELSLVEDSVSRKELLELIRQHYLHTGSALAGRMLDDWHRYIEDFIQVVPIEYKRVLEEEKMKKLHEKIADIQRDY
ncbi:glutamate synthase large subunit [Prevotella communis]|uniref:glutamate synthase large subunit n=1 Tax=Prevotella communis TaxID=2913614 RepID=UPI001EDA1F46|nr:glutamate synthase large subunit [Prevotella communis]UKK67646.1 glutamate synthase large subunit [Prevotella communis]UKK70207.1 glutamate synthase large subunit [Prevotella communis]